MPDVGCGTDAAAAAVAAGAAAADAGCGSEAVVGSDWPVESSLSSGPKVTRFCKRADIGVALEVDSFTDGSADARAILSHLPPTEPWT